MPIVNSCIDTCSFTQYLKALLYCKLSYPMNSEVTSWFFIVISTNEIICYTLSMSSRTMPFHFPSSSIPYSPSSTGTILYSNPTMAAISLSRSTQNPS